MRVKEIATGVALVATLSAGCGSEGIQAENPDGIERCDKSFGPSANSRGTNTAPTYFEAEEGYHPTTDPYVLLEVQEEEAAKPNSSIGEVGLGAIICITDTDEAELGQVLTYTALELSKIAIQESDS